MSKQNVVQETFDQFAKGANFTKKSGSWCRRERETITVLNLQKSQYGVTYFINVAFWLLAVEDADFPKENKCHFRARVENLLPQRDRELRVLLDLADTVIVEDNRRSRLSALLEADLLPIVDSCSTLDGLRNFVDSHPDSFLVHKDAMPFLGRSGS